jgi:hypothetical protein
MKLAARVGLVALALAGLIGFRLAQSFHAFTSEDDRMAAFASAVAEYVKLADAPLASQAPYLRGKLVTVDLDKRAVDYRTYPHLPEDLKAMAPSEVGTVALIRWGREHVGVYVNADTHEETGEAYRSTAEVTLLDWSSRQVIGRTSFRGEAPAGGLTQKGDYQSERPMFKIRRYLEQLPRQ